ncbi:MAG TPA: hypothetical protein P5120_10540 [Spirochaetota bacterium]|nr:hypothetical protein [Spirochaetota bacterium]HPF04788.1 hypothetical protein [Spirochaetota bacterium]HPJ41095.1 hypothetical protein [Spirochaetota bacterium]HPR37991.1 hypothetical protein [Spirochaetota bacterium]HRX47944.1 hypothetical protein [Spirochaetota bacterium]
MKKIAVFILIAITAAGCSKNEGISFCEGVDTEGKGVNCGRVFTTGDLTGVITSKTPFEADSLTVKITKIDGDKKKVEKTFTVEAGREKTSANTTFQFYNSGKYLVEAVKGDEKIAEGSIEIRDTY